MVSVFTILWLVAAMFSYKALIVPTLTLKSLTLPLFFMATVVSGIFSLHGQEALTAIEVKLSFILVPFLFYCYSWPIEIIRRCLTAFVSGNFIAAVLLLGRSITYAINGQTEYFFYTNFSYFLHASYFAMYICLSLVIITLYYPTWYAHQPALKKMTWVYATVLTITVFLCASKMGLISFLILAPLLLLYRFKNALNFKSMMTAMVIGIALLLALPSIFPTSFERLKSITSLDAKQIDPTATESSAVRILVWKQTLHLIAERPLTGFGVGDANEALYQAYRKHGLTGALEHHLNTHNQYLQSFLGMGIFGLIGILLITFYGFFDGIKHHHFLFFAFSLLLTLNFLVESMLQTAAGVLFTAAFFTLLSKTPHVALLHIPKTK